MMIGATTTGVPPPPPPPPPTTGGGVAATTVIVSVLAGPVPVALFALSDTVETPTVVGVPVIVGAAAEPPIERPAGSVPRLKLVGAFAPVPVPVTA